MEPADETAVKPPVAPPGRRRKRLLSCGCIGFALLVAFLCYIGVLGGNVREVDPGRFYRSSQLTGSGYEAVSARIAGRSLAAVIEAHHIKTLLNLRGGSMKDARYREEIDTCRAHGVVHIDDAFSARFLPTPDALNRMVDVFDHAQYPIIVHCQAGSDRTGLASTIYAVIVMHQSLDRAESNQLTWRYGHFAFGIARPMDTFFDLYRADSRGLSLRDWIKSVYPAVYARENRSGR